MLSNQQIAEVFYDIADRMEVLGEDHFKIRAYRRAAATLAELPLSVAEYHGRNALQELPGIGAAIGAKINQLLSEGKVDLLERLKTQVPEGVLAMMRVPGVGHKTALRLYQELGISDLPALQAAATGGQLRTLKGVGKKLEAAVLAYQPPAQPTTPQWLLGEAWPLAQKLVQDMRSLDPSISEASVAGSVRRGLPIVGDLDLVIAAPDPAATLERLLHAPHVAQITETTATTATVQLHNQVGCSLLVTEPATWGSALLLWTGNAQHRESLQQRAQELGLRLALDGLWQGQMLLPAATEADVYHALVLPWIAPELREGNGEIEAAREGRLPRLLEERDIQADLHMHTAWSDGSGTVLQRAYACLARGYRYAVITDHSAYMGMVQGLDHARLREQRAEIEAANATLAEQGHAFRLLQGCEVDILPDGSLALPDEALAELDWVIASLHVSLKQERSVITERLLRAIHHPHVDCIGHPSGRLLLRRDGADLDWDVILQAAADTGTVLEIDGAYQRLDLDWSLARRALELGINLALGSDAHADSELDYLRYGVLTARRAWATAATIVNTWDWPTLQAHANRARRG